MANPKTHRILVTTGCLMWGASFFGEVYKGQPYSTIGIVFSPFLTLIGIFFWFKYYRATREHLPNIKTVWNNTSYIGGRFKLDSDFILTHLQEFFTFCILFWMGLVLIMTLTFRRSDAFETTRNYCRTNQEILSQTGMIKYFGVLVAGNISSGAYEGNADLSFTIVAEKGNFSANSILTKHSGVWKVENIKLE